MVHQAKPPIRLRPSHNISPYNIHWLADPDFRSMALHYNIIRGEGIINVGCRVIHVRRAYIQKVIAHTIRPYAWMAGSAALARHAPRGDVAKGPCPPSEAIETPL